MDFQQILEQKYTEAITKTSSLPIIELPKALTSEILQLFKADSKFLDYRIVINTSVFGDIEGDVKNVSAGLFGEKDGIVTLSKQVELEGKSWTISISLTYIKV